MNKELSKKILGLDKESVINILERENVTYRVAQTDQVYHILTRDFNPKRVNLHFIGGKLSHFSMN